MTSTRPAMLIALFAIALGFPAVAPADPPSQPDPVLVASIAVDEATGATQGAEDVVQLNRLQRWDGSFNGCMTQATPEERARALSLNYTCACLATYIVNLCAPADFTTNGEVEACTGTNIQGIYAVSEQCFGYGSLQVVAY